MQAGACLGVALLECWAVVVSATDRQRLSRRSGGGREEGEGGDHAAPGEGGGVCLCDEMLSGEQKQLAESPFR